ncbi:MAG: DNA polymerase III subunit delta [Pelagibacteraceae bacterium]|nr:DNA polymerase III subunit delta [Pelagibacteraceae bacterium]
MIIKSFILEKKISLMDEYFVALFYGENIGMKDEIKDQIKKHYKNSEKITFHQDEIIKNDKLLNEHAHNMSLFAKNKIIIINEVSDKIKNKIAAILEKPKKDLKIFLFAQNLEKKSTIRLYFEKEKNVAIIPCYQDNERTLSEYLRKKFAGYVGLNQEIINLLIRNSGLDRQVLSGEVDKIKGLFLDKKINREKLITLVNNAYNLDFNNLRDASLSADKEMLNKNLGNIMLQNEDAYFYLNNLNFRIEKLLKLNEEFQKHKNIEVAMDNIRPRIFWKDKPIFYKQIKIWNLKKLEEAKKIMVETEILIKTKLNNYNNILIKNLLVKLCNKAASSF